MSLYKKVLCLRDKKSLCKQTILTQNHFHNIIHKDNGSVMDKKSTPTIINSDFISHPKRKQIQTYVNKVNKKTREVYQKVQHVSVRYVKIAKIIVLCRY